MEKIVEGVELISHNVQIHGRKSIIISGIKKIENFNSEEFFIESIQGYILVKGESLELIKLDTLGGSISIKGRIDSLIYLNDENRKQKKESILSKLFK